MPKVQKQVPYKVCSFKLHETCWKDLILAAPSVVRTNLRRPSMGEGSDDIRKLVYWTVLKGMRFSFAFIIRGKGKDSMKKWSSLETLGYPCCVSGRERGWGTTKCRNSTGGIDILSYVAYKLYIAGLDKGLPASQSYKKIKQYQWQ